MRPAHFTGDVTLPMGPQAVSGTTNLIQALTADGFQVGSDDMINVSSGAHWFVALRSETAVPMPQPLGTPCSLSSRCASLTCADGVCCNSACTGLGESCSVPGSEGTCVTVDGGTAVDGGTGEPPEDGGTPTQDGGLPGDAGAQPGDAGEEPMTGGGTGEPVGETDGGAGEPIAGADGGNGFDDRDRAFVIGCGCGASAGGGRLALLGLFTWGVARIRRRRRREVVHGAPARAPEVTGSAVRLRKGLRSASCPTSRPSTATTSVARALRPPT